MTSRIILTLWTGALAAVGLYANYMLALHWPLYDHTTYILLSLPLTYWIAGITAMATLMFSGIFFTETVAIIKDIRR